MKLGVGEEILTLCLTSLGLFLLLSPYKFLFFLILIWTIYLIYLRNEKYYWIRHGLPGPKPNLLWGNDLELKQRGLHDFDLENFKLYGDTYGTYVDGCPDIITRDLEVLRQVLVTNTNHFDERNDIILNIARISPNDKHSLPANVLTSKIGTDFKRVRRIITNAFTTVNLRKLLPIFNECATEFCRFLEPISIRKEKIPIKQAFEKLTLSIMIKCVFGINTNCCDDEQLAKNAHAFTMVSFLDYRVMLIRAFPNIAQAFRKITGQELLNDLAEKFFRKYIETKFEERINDPDANEKYHDLFQTLLNSYQNGNVETDINGNNIINKKKLTKSELFAHTFIFIVAGYETLASALQFITYILANFPAIQDRVRNEIVNVLAGDANITGDHIHQLTYMQQVINETLRMYHSVARTTRSCTHDFTFSNGIHMKKGQTISVPIYGIHYDERNYPNPYEFNPDRFAPGSGIHRDPILFMPFGYGNHGCIGMRLAEYELKVVLAHLLKNYSFYVNPNDGSFPFDITSVALSKSKTTLYVYANRI